MSDYGDEEYSKRGIDYDLYACLEYNPQGSFTVDEIEKVLAVHEGENDGDDWRWILQLKDGRYVFLQGGCDYTGWDCQSWAGHNFAESPEAAAKFAINEQLPGDPSTAGLSHTLKIMNGEYGENDQAAYESLMKQIAEGKDQTWREAKDIEFGFKPDDQPEE